MERKNQNKNVNTDKHLFEKNEEKIIERILTLKQIINEKRATPVDYHDLAIHYYLMKNYEKCIQTIENLLKIYPDYIDRDRAIKLKIVCLIYLQKYDNAIKEIQGRLKINPQDTFLLSCLAFSYEKKNDIKKAIEIHRKILNIDPDKTSSLNSYGYLILTTTQNKNEILLAGKYIKRAIDKKPDNPYYLDSYAMFLNKIGNKQLAKEYITKALKLEPDNIDIIMHLKEILNTK